MSPQSEDTHPDAEKAQLELLRQTSVSKRLTLAFSQGGEVSERQWNDVVGVLKVQQLALDFEYLQHWAAELGLTALLQRALCESGL
jgi:hypothetical protein